MVVLLLCALLLVSGLLCWEALLCAACDVQSTVCETLCALTFPATGSSAAAVDLLTKEVRSSLSLLEFVLFVFMLFVLFVLMLFVLMLLLVLVVFLMLFVLFAVVLLMFMLFVVELVLFEGGSAL